MCPVARLIFQLEPKHILSVGTLITQNRIGGVIFSRIALNTVEGGFEPWSGQLKDYTIGICCFTAKHTTLGSESKDW